MRALVSVSDKCGVVEFAQNLRRLGWEIIATGGTMKLLQESGVEVINISDVTGFPEICDGRVKTLHPKVHAGILAIRDKAAHMDSLNQLGVAPIDLVCVNLYPFFDKVQAGLSFEETVEFIDIGGPTMLRSAAKNWQDVLVLTDPADYADAMEEIASGSKNLVLHRLARCSISPVPTMPPCAALCSMGLIRLWRRMGPPALIPSCPSTIPCPW